MPVGEDQHMHQSGRVKRRRHPPAGLIAVPRLGEADTGASYPCVRERHRSRDERVVGDVGVHDLTRRRTAKD